LWLVRIALTPKSFAISMPLAWPGIERGAERPVVVMQVHTLQLHSPVVQVKP
jgi:hypothetical protein